MNQWPVVSHRQTDLHNVYRVHLDRRGIEFSRDRYWLHTQI